MIYSQFYLMSKGVAITWDNPDIQLFDGGGVGVASHALTPSTPYEIRARIWNGSTDAPAVNALEALSKQPEERAGIENRGDCCAEREPAKPECANERGVEHDVDRDGRRP